MMLEKINWTYVIIVLFIIMIFFNRKVRLFSIFKMQISVLKNDRKSKISLWDLFCFVIIPLVISVLVVYMLGFMIPDRLVNYITNISTIMFTILLGFVTILIDRSNTTSNNAWIDVNKETIVSILTAIIFSITICILSILLEVIDSKFFIQISTVVIIDLSLMILMLLLMIIKRVYCLYIDK